MPSTTGGKRIVFREALWRKKTKKVLIKCLKYLLELKTVSKWKFIGRLAWNTELCLKLLDLFSVLMHISRNDEK